MNKVAHFLTCIVFIVMSIYTGHIFFSDPHRTSGILFCIAMGVLGIPSLRNELIEYHNAKMENNHREACEVLFHLSKSVGLVFSAIGIAIYLLCNWYNWEW
ncbi:MAG: hypothetical protein Ta2B_00580 [Termitinemataceae bacterium]|nr:MAG: hypothetical protein Ta2B_00580 [Termitinemataceae bacterium]